MQIPPIFIVIAGLAIGLLVFFVPRVGLMFILLGTLFLPEIPLGTTETGIGLQRQIEIRAEDIFMIIVALGWFIGLIARRTPIKIPHTPLNAPIIIFSVLMVISSVWGVFKETTPPAAGFFFTLKKIQYFLVFFMVIANLKTFNQVRFNIALILAFATIVAFWGMLDNYITPLARASGPFRTDQNALLGGFLLIISFMAMAFIVRYPRWQSYAYLLPLIIISLYAIAFTTSRASYVGLFSGLIFFALLSRKHYLLVLPALLLFAIFYLLPDRVREATYSIQGVVPQTKVVNTSWGARVGAWKAAIPKIANNPILGHGPGSFPLAWADNQYVTDLLYMGFLGLGVFAWMIWRIFMSVRPLRTLGPPSYLALKREAGNNALSQMQYYTATLTLGYLTGLVALLVHGMAVATFYTVRIMVPFWYLTGLMMITLNLVNQNLSDVQDSGTVSST
jgi:O-antigen ligase